MIPDETAVIDAGRYLEKIGRMWSKATIEEKQQITRLMIKAVEVDVAQRNITAIHVQEPFRQLLREVCTLTDITVR